MGLGLRNFSESPTITSNSLPTNQHTHQKTELNEHDLSHLATPSPVIAIATNNRFQFWAVGMTVE
jgi:hypothetical protein